VGKTTISDCVGLEALAGMGCMRRKL